MIIISKWLSLELSLLLLVSLVAFAGFVNLQDRESLNEYSDELVDSDDAGNELSGQARWRAGQRVIDKLRNKRASPPAPALAPSANPSCGSLGGTKCLNKKSACPAGTGGLRPTYDCRYMCCGPIQKSTPTPTPQPSPTLISNLIHDSPPVFSIKKVGFTGKSGCYVNEVRNDQYFCWRNGYTVPIEQQYPFRYDKGFCEQECPKILSKECIKDEECSDGKSETLDYCNKGSCEHKTFSCYDLLINGKEEDKLDIVFVAEDFKTEADFSLLERQTPLHISELLRREPFYSDYKKINFHLVSGQLNFGRSGDSNSEYIFLSYKQEESAAKKCFPKAEEIVVLLNIPEANREMGAIGAEHHAISGINNPATTVHEFGHSFGGLSDEYIAGTYNGNPSSLTEKSCLYGRDKIINVDSNAGCPKWCAGPPLNLKNDECTLIKTENGCRTHNRDNIGAPTVYQEDGMHFDQTRVCAWLPEPHPFFGSRCVKMTDNLNLGTNCMPGTGCYFGAGRTQYCWRSVPDSIMNSLKNTLPFSPPAVKHMKDLLAKYK